jgi:hypothetical protein
MLCQVPLKDHFLVSPGIGLVASGAKIAAGGLYNIFGVAAFNML